jgi:hypothetical protein
MVTRETEGSGKTVPVLSKDNSENVDERSAADVPMQPAHQAGDDAANLPAVDETARDAASSSYGTPQWDMSDAEDVPGNAPEGVVPEPVQEEPMQWHINSAQDILEDAATAGRLNGFAEYTLMNTCIGLCRIALLRRLVRDKMQVFQSLRLQTAQPGLPRTTQDQIKRIHRMLIVPRLWTCGCLSPLARDSIVTSQANCIAWPLCPA